MKKLWIILSGTAFMLSGCGGHSTEDYADNTPKLDIRQYFNGPVEAHGIIYDMTGKADLSFTAKMHGTWVGNQGTFDEEFTFSDGRKDTRIWHIAMIDDHHFTATAGDVIGNAVGSQHGNVMNMKYVLKAKRASGKTIELSMDDWMYLLEDNTIINRIKMRKFGLNVGEMVITFRKP